MMIWMASAKGVLKTVDPNTQPCRPPFLIRIALSTDP